MEWAAFCDALGYSEGNGFAQEAEFAPTDFTAASFFLPIRPRKSDMSTSDHRGRSLYRPTGH